MYPNNNCNDCPDCPGTITPLPLPDLSGLCGDEYNAACVIYTGEDITCLGIESGMSFLEVLNIFNNTLPICDCCEQIPQDCVVSAWGPWSGCQCYYDENDELICGRQTRTRTVITPAANGGAECGPLVDYKVCDVEDVCFTFGSDICETPPDATQILASPTGILNSKPYYLLEFSCGAPDLYVWYSNSTLLWHITPVLGTTNSVYQTLNNNSNYLPISNDTTQRWSFVEDGGYNNLIASQITTCPDANICFKFTIEIDGTTSTFYENIAPTSLGEGSFPLYQWSNNDVPDGPYIITVGYNPSEDKWVHVVSNAIDTAFLVWSTLDTNTFYPFSTSTIQWQPVENIAGYNSQMLLSTLDACTAPPDVDCVWTCTDWSPCNFGCTQTRTCTITTPASGNGTCEPPPPTQQSCCVPSCAQPISPVVTIVGANIEITFAAIAGAVEYTLTYTSDGGATYTNVVSTTPSFSFPWECGKTYSGWIVTNCATLNSAQTTFSITMDPCPAGPPCGSLYQPFISGVVGSNTQTFKIDANGVTDNLSPNTTWSVSGGIVWTEKLTSTGFFVGGAFTQLPVGSIRWGLAKLLCNGQTDPSFIVTTGFIEYANTQTGKGTVFTIDVDTTLQRVYVGGNFSKWNGTPCNNIVCLNYNGTIVTAFNTGTGITSAFPGGNADVYSIKVQPDNKILVGGNFYIYNSAPVRGFMRLNTNGTLDSTFLLGTSFVDFPNNYPSIRDIELDTNGDMFVAGQFVSYQGVTSKSFVKIRSNGVIETAFPILNKFTFPSAAPIIRAALLVGNFVYVAGYFNTYNGTPAVCLVKLDKNNATLDPTFALNTITTPGAVIQDVKLAANGNILIGGNLQGYRSSTNKFYYILNPTTGEVVATSYPSFGAGTSQIASIGVF